MTATTRTGGTGSTIGTGRRVRQGCEAYDAKSRATAHRRHGFTFVLAAGGTGEP